MASEPPVVRLSDRTPVPGKVVVFSTEDLPTRIATGYEMLMGRPAVVEVDGEPIRVRTSPGLPAGYMYVIDEARLQADLDAALASMTFAYRREGSALTVDARYTLKPHSDEVRP